MRLYKITDANGLSFRKTQWGEGVTHNATGEGGLCSSGWLHSYTSPKLAALLNPLHTKYEVPQLWLAEGKGKFKRDHGLKIGCTSLTTIKKMELPVYTMMQRTAFSILCAKTVCKDITWNKWADDWLSRADRTSKAAYAAAYVAAAAHYAATTAFAMYADAAASYAAHATIAAATYVDTRNSSNIATPALATFAATYAAHAAQAATYAAHAADPPLFIPLIPFAIQVLKVQ